MVRFDYVRAIIHIDYGCTNIKDELNESNWLIYLGGFGIWK